jgi:hypothetical protein
MTNKTFATKSQTWLVAMVLVTRHDTIARNKEFFIGRNKARDKKFNESKPRDSALKPTE